MGQTQDTGRAPRVATVPALLWLVLFCAYRIDFTLSAPAPFNHMSGLTAASGAAAVVVLGALHLLIVLRRVSRRQAIGILVAQAILTYAPYAVVGVAWGPISALLMVALLRTFGGRTPWLAAVLIGVGEFVIRVVFFPETGFYFACWAALATFAPGLSYFALVRLADLVRELHATRGELAPLEVARERLRIARGLADVLGTRLTLIIRVGRRAAADLDEAQVTEVVTVARQALAEIRSISDDYRDRSLSEEVEAARSVLTAAGVPTSIHAPPLRLVEQVDAALAMVLRRTVIAALEHGAAERCRIELDGSARLRVSFTGPVTAPFGEVLAQAAGEIESLGGWLDAGAGVEARVPTRHRSRAPRVRGAVGAAPWLAWAVLLALELDFSGTTVLNMLQSHYGSGLRYSPAQIVLTATALPLIGVLQLRHVRPSRDGSPPRAWQWTLALQIVLILVTMGVIGTDVPPYVGLAAGVVLFHVRAPWSWGIATVLIGTLIPLRYGYDLSAANLFATASPVLMMLSVYALCRLPMVIRQLAEARQEVARMAVLKERLRIARDVHDLLGFHLSAIVVKGELAARLAARDPRTARRHLTESVMTAERALAAVRSITHESTGLSLAEEAETARSMLTAAGIDARIELASGGTGSLLAIVLREAVTNVVRHAHPRVCEIGTSLHAGSVRLRVSNDGAFAETGGRHGTGLANLRSRVEEAGGRLTVRREDDRFTLIAELPAAALGDRSGDAMAVA